MQASPMIGAYYELRLEFDDNTIRQYIHFCLKKHVWNAYQLLLLNVWTYGLMA